MKSSRASLTTLIGTGSIKAITAIFFCAQALWTLPSSAATLSWSGAGTTGNWTDAANWGLAGTPAAGDTLIFVSGALRPSNTNNIVGLELAQIRFAGAGGGFSIYGSAISLTKSIAATNTAGANVINTDITIPSGINTMTVGSGATLSLLGSIGGSAALIKNG